jgi:hypothetical protein
MRISAPFASNADLYKPQALPDTAFTTQERTMAEEEQFDDTVVQFKVEDGKQPGSYELYIKTKSEEFDFQLTGEQMQQLGDAIYEAIDKNEGKQ